MFYGISSVPPCGALWPGELSWWLLGIRALPGASAEEGGLGWGAVDESERFTGDGPGARGEPWRDGNGCPLRQREKRGPGRASAVPERMALPVGPCFGGGWRVCKLLPIALPERMRETPVAL